MTFHDTGVDLVQYQVNLELMVADPLKCRLKLVVQDLVD
jgi:hypothetical protein